MVFSDNKSYVSSLLYPGVSMFLYFGITILLMKDDEGTTMLFSKSSFR